MGYEQREILDHDIHIDADKEATFCEVVREGRFLDKAPADAGAALWAYNILSEFDEEGTATMLDLDWMSGDGWSTSLYEALASCVHDGDFLEMRHIDENGDVDHFRVVFSDGAWTYSHPSVSWT